MRGEPVITYVSIGALVAAVLNVLIASGVDISSQLAEAILHLVAVAAPLAIAAWKARREVSPVRDDSL